MNEWKCRQCLAKLWRWNEASASQSPKYLAVTKEGKVVGQIRVCNNNNNSNDRDDNNTGC